MRTREETKIEEWNEHDDSSATMKKINNVDDKFHMHSICKKAET
jgi:hypothetical protein